MEDPYQTLGVSRDCSQDAIRRAYRKLAKKHHPDLNPGNPEAEERFKVLSVANELLSDPDMRARFDNGEIDAAGRDEAPRSSYRAHAEGEQGRRYRPTWSTSDAWPPDDMDDAFAAIFNRLRGRDDATMQADDVHCRLTTTFLEAVGGATRRLTLADGRTLDVKIPPGTTDGQVLRLRGQAGPGRNGGPPGDLLVEIGIARQSSFVRDGQDLRLTLPVSLTEAVLGGAVEVPTPGGSVRLRIPAGSDPGTQLRLRGRGVPASRGHEAGDLYAELRVVLGPPDPALTDFLRTWAPEHAGDPRRTMEAA